MFEDSTFESAGSIHTRSNRWALVTLTINCTVVAFLILIPLFYTGALPRESAPILLTAPMPPIQVEPTAPRPIHAQVEAPSITNLFTAQRPILTPIFRSENPAPASADNRIAFNRAILHSGVPDFPGSSTSPVVTSEPPRTMRVSSPVIAGLLIEKTLPTYPVIAKSADIEGTVVLEAIISKTGTIENLRIISGPSLLQQAALDAVKNWRYRPYILDGEAIEVETTVSVIFSLGRK